MKNLGISDGANPPSGRSSNSVKAPIGASKVELERIELDKWKEETSKAAR